MCLGITFITKLAAANVTLELSDSRMLRHVTTYARSRLQKLYRKRLLWLRSCARRLYKRAKLLWHCEHLCSWWITRPEIRDIVLCKNTNTDVGTAFTSSKIKNKLLSVVSTSGTKRRHILWNCYTTELSNIVSMFNINNILGTKNSKQE